MDAIDTLLGFAKEGAQVAGHKYLSRKPKPGGGWIYEYRHPQGHTFQIPVNVGQAGGSRSAEIADGAPEGPVENKARKHALQHAMKNPEGEAKPEAAKPEAKEEPSPERHWVESVTEHGLPKDTQKHYAPQGEYAPARAQMHERIIAKFFDHVPSVPKGQDPVAVITMGGMAAGKSTLVKHLMGDAHDFVDVNPDKVKEELPEFQQGISLGTHDGKPVAAKDAAAAVHEESSDVAKELRKRSIAERKNMIIDRSGDDVKKMHDIIRELKAQGYHVRLVMAHVPYEMAQKRAVSRANKEGRYVLEHVLARSHHVVPGNFEPIAKEADDFMLFDTGTGGAPRPVWTGAMGGQHKVHDPTYVNEFKRIGQERHAIAKEKGWMKSLAESTLRKAMAERKTNPSVSLDEMLHRVKTPRGESHDHETGLDWDWGGESDGEGEKKPAGKADDKAEKSLDPIDALEPLVKAGPFYDAARSGTEVATVGEDAARDEEQYQALFGKKTVDGKHVDVHPTSEAQVKWAWAAESRGELPKGTARKWAKRFYGKKTAKSEGHMDAIDALQKAGERAGHLYISRKPNARGGFDYEYAHPEQEGKAVQVSTAREADTKYGHVVRATVADHPRGDRVVGRGKHTKRGWEISTHGADGHVKGIARHAIDDTKQHTGRVMPRVDIAEKPRFTQGPDKPGGWDFAARGIKTKKSESFAQHGDSMLRKGLYVFDLSQSGRKTSDVPENMLYDYLCSFIEEANEHEAREPQHRNPMAGEDVYAVRAMPIMHELVQFVPLNPNLKRACAKYRVTTESIAEILKAKGFVKPATDAHHDHGDYWSHDWDSMSAMGVRENNGPTGEVMMASMTLREDHDARPGVQLRKADALVRYEADGAVGPIDPRVRVRGFVETPVQAVNPDCIIHGVRDLTKSQNLNNKMSVCRC